MVPKARRSGRLREWRDHRGLCADSQAERSEETVRLERTALQHCVSHVFMQQALWIPKPGAAPMRPLLHEGEALETTRDSCTASLMLMPSLQLQQKTGPGPVGTLDGVATLLP